MPGNSVARRKHGAYRRRWKSDVLPQARSAFYPAQRGLENAVGFDAGDVLRKRSGAVDFVVVAPLRIAVSVDLNRR